MSNKSLYNGQKVKDSSCGCKCHSNDKPTCNSYENFFYQHMNDEFELDGTIIELFKQSLTRNDHESLITFIDWDTTGDFLLCCQNSCIILHNLSKNIVRNINCKKYGVQAGCFVQEGESHCIVATQPIASDTIPSTCLSLVKSLERIHWSKVNHFLPNVYVTSPISQTQAKTQSQAQSFSHPQSLDQPDNTPKTSTLRYLDLQENRYVKSLDLQASLRSSCGLSTSLPPYNLFLACCTNKKVVLFNLENDIPLTSIQTQVQSPLGKLSSCGMLAAVQILPMSVQLFDFRQGWENSDYIIINISECIKIDDILDPHFITDYAKSQPLEHFYIMTSLHIMSSPPLLFVTLTDRLTQSSIIQFNAITGQKIDVYSVGRFPNQSRSSYVYKWKINGYNSNDIFHFVPGISLDGNFLACGDGPNQNIKIWSLKKGSQNIIKSLDSSPFIPRFVQWNPKFSLLVSSFDHLSLWTP